MRHASGLPGERVQARLSLVFPRAAGIESARARTPHSRVPRQSQF
jgi:hypothetical protein